MTEVIPSLVHASKKALLHLLGLLTGVLPDSHHRTHGAQADKIKRPLLLVHGEDDNNTGTFPMQSERFYAALKGHGAATRLVLLPHESHGYSARESVMHVLAEMDAWLRRYCEAPAAAAAAPAAAAEEEAAAAEQPLSKL